MLSEWCNPPLALRAGFDMDFYLNVIGNGYSTLMRDYLNQSGEAHSYFKKDAGGNINCFLDEYLRWYADTKGKGYISLLTCNHDTPRPRNNLNEAELKLVYAFLFTMPGVPFLYYGDEIGMRYLPLPTKEGGYFRTGSRTPMQWDSSTNLGFSEVRKEDLYLPVDSADDAPTVEEQEKDPSSLLHTVRDILALRHRYEDLQADADFSVICSEPGKPFIYQRGKLILALNPNSQSSMVPVAQNQKKVLYQIGDADFGKGVLTLGGQSFVVLESV